MAKRKSKLDKNNENQLNLFDMIEQINPGKYASVDFQIETKDLGLRLKDAISEAISNSGIKRYEIAGQMSEYLGVEITASMLNSYTAESKEGHRMPAEYYPTFCRITNNFKILEILTAAAGARMTRTEEIYYLEIGRLQQIEEEARRKRQAFKRELKGMRGGGASG